MFTYPSRSDLGRRLPKTTKYRRRSTLAASGASAPAARVARPLLLSPDSALDCLAGDSPPSPVPALAIACPTPDAGTVRYRTRSILVDRTARVRLRRVLCVLRVCSCRQCASGPPVHARGGHELVLIPASRPGRFRVPRAHQDVGVIMPSCPPPHQPHRQTETPRRPRRRGARDADTCNPSSGRCRRWSDGPSSCG